MGFLDFLFGKPKQELVEQIVRKEVQAQVQQARQAHEKRTRKELEEMGKEHLKEAIAQGKPTDELVERIRHATEEGVKAEMAAFDETAEKEMQKGVQEAMQEFNEKSRRNR